MKSYSTHMDRILTARPYIIAEVGSNWHNSDDCIDSIKAARDCGVDAVKFQLFTPGELYGPKYKDHPMPHQLPREWVPKLKEVADSLGVDFMCTAFSYDGYQFIDPFVKAHKIACAEGEWEELIEHVLKFGKPTITSVISLPAVQPNNSNLILLACDPTYPSFMSPPTKLRFKEGYSDHTLGIAASVAATQNGAFVIEKHFRLDRVCNTPDAPHSLTPDLMNDLVYEAKQVGGGEIGNGKAYNLDIRNSELINLRGHNFETKLKRQAIQGGMYRPAPKDWV